MSLFVLDTDVLTLLQKGHPDVCRQAFARPLSELAITVISVEERLTGWYTQLRRSKRREILARLYQDLTDCVQCL